MKNFLITIFLFLSLTLNAQHHKIYGKSEDCIIELQIEISDDIDLIKSIDIEYSPNGIDFTSFDELIKTNGFQTVCYQSNNVIDYFRIKFERIDRIVNFSETVEIVNNCQKDEPL